MVRSRKVRKYYLTLGKWLMFNVQTSYFDGGRILRSGASKFGVNDGIEELPIPVKILFDMTLFCKSIAF